MIIPNIWKNKKCSKPPTSLSFESDVETLAAYLGIMFLRTQQLKPILTQFQFFRRWFSHQKVLARHFESSSQQNKRFVL